MELLDIKKMFSVETTGEFKTLELTDEQYKRLLLLINLGKGFIIEEFGETEKGLENIHQHILSFSKHFNATEEVTFDEKIAYFMTEKNLDEKTHVFINEYKENNFLFELSDRFAARDIEELEKSQPKRTIDEIEDLELEYLDEFDKNGIKNLRFIK